MGQALYQKMYGVLCGAISDAVDALQEPTNAEHVRTMLVTAMLKTEEMYVSAEEEKRLE